MFQTSRHEKFSHTAFAQQEAVWTSIPQPSATFTDCKQGELNHSSSVAVSPFQVKAPPFSHITPYQQRPTHHSVSIPQGLMMASTNETRDEKRRRPYSSHVSFELATLMIFQLAQFATPLEVFCWCATVCW